MTAKDKKENKIAAKQEDKNTSCKTESADIIEDNNEDKSPLTELNKKIEAATKDAKESYERFLRVSAEFENYKKRVARETEDFRKYANETFIKELLPVIDNLERAVNSSKNDTNCSKGILEGVHITLSEILKVFEKFGVTSFDSIDKAFDPGFHQAVMQEEAEGKNENIVLKELQKGYLIHNRLLRPAMVVVSKATNKI